MIRVYGVRVIWSIENQTINDVFVSYTRYAGTGYRAAGHYSTYCCCTRPYEYDASFIFKLSDFASQVIQAASGISGLWAFHV